MEGREDKRSSYKGGDVTSPSVFICMFSYVCPSTEPRFLSLSMCVVCVCTSTLMSRPKIFIKAPLVPLFPCGRLCSHSFF